uniref:NudC domain-containing protein 1 n=1 Tax=Schistocephalus solidus TaxID=70667 RepID=A0A0X3P160_SCHSO
MNVQAKPNRDLLDPNFESYKLSLRRTAVLSASEPNGIDLKTLGHDTFSKLEIRLHFLHNAVFQDSFLPDTFYYFTADGQIKGVVIRRRKELFCSGSTVWKVPSWAEPPKRGSKCNASMKLLSNYAIVCDGAHNLYLLDTGDRTSKGFSPWKVAMEFELPTVAPSAYLMDAIQSPTSLEINCLLLSVAAASGSSKSEVHLDWLTFGIIVETWSLARHRRLSSPSFPDYAVFEHTSSFLTVCTSDPFSAVHDSANPEVKPSEPSQSAPQPSPEDDFVTSSVRFTWSQCPPDASEDDSRLVNVLIHLGSQKSPNVSKEAFKISCISCAPEDHTGFAMHRLIIQMLTEDSEKPPISLCNARLFAPVDCNETMWTYDKETNSLDVTLLKTTPTPWLRLFADVTEEERLNVQYDETTSGSSRLGQTDIDAGQMQGNFNVEQLEDVDMAATDDDVDLLLQRIDGATLKTTMKVELLGNQWLYNAPLKAAGPASHLLCVRHDVDGLLWCPAPQWPLHVATLQAFGYVLASKQSHRFVVSPPAHITGANFAHLPFVAVADLSRHIYVYWQPPARCGADELEDAEDDDAVLLPGPGDGDTELRKRRVGGGEGELRVVHVAWQQVLSLPDAEEIIGFAALASPLPACIVATKQRLYLTSLVEEN